MQDILGYITIIGAVGYLVYHFIPKKNKHKCAGSGCQHAPKKSPKK